jgi:glycosyltransferase involved in cell wall biosynthesis
MRVFMITSEWPTPQAPMKAPFLVRQVEFLRRAGIEVEVFSFRGAKNPANYFRAWRRAQRCLTRRRFDLVHAQWGQSALLALPKRLPLVITFRGNDLEGIVGRNGRYTALGRIQAALSQQMVRYADEVIVVSESLGHRLPRDRGYDVIPSGLDLELFRSLPQHEARQRLGLPPEKRLVLFAVGSVEDPRKRYTLARSVVERLQREFDVELVVASGVEHASMPYYMNACDALILTSVHEGSPNVVKEALACNLPVVSVDVGDVRQRIGSIHGCIVCGDDTLETLAAGLAEVLRKRERIAGRGSVQDLDERLIARRVAGIYEKAVGRALPVGEQLSAQR